MTDYKPDMVLYHANCADGFGAAWAAWTRWGDEVEYYPASHGMAPPSVKGKHVLIGDFSYKHDVMVEMGKEAASIIILDHHKSAEADLAEWTVVEHSPLSMEQAVHMTNIRPGGIVASFDMNRSGAQMMWDFCHPGTSTPKLIQLIQDRDLWKFEYPETKPFGMWLSVEKFDFARWERIADDLEVNESMELIMAEAQGMQRFFNSKIDELISRTRMETIAGQLVPVCNAPSMFASELGHKLLDVYPNAPFSASYSDTPHGRVFSLRSRDERMDVSEIAVKFGGGGHRNAAGFTIDLPKWQMSILQPE